MAYIFIALIAYALIATTLIFISYTERRKGQSAETPKLSSHHKALISIAASIFTLITLSFFILYRFDINVEGTNLGQIGDFVGGILNPAFSFLALIAILFSISIQEKDLADSINGLKTQETILQRQAFETSFFNLLNLLRSRRMEISEVRVGNKDMHYAQAFGILVRRKRATFAALSKKQAHADAKVFVKDSIKDSGHTLRQQFKLIRSAIESGHLPEKQKRYYYRIAKNDFSQAEICMLANMGIPDKILRKTLREYNIVNIKDEYLASPFLNDYYSPKKKTP